jgi:hypothetical protein
MIQVKRLGAVGLLAFVAAFTVGLEGQAGDPASLIQAKLVTQIKVTKSTADHSDIVTAGDVVLLHKDGLMMCSSASTYAFSNTYTNGVLSANYKNRVKDAVKSFGFGHIPVFGGGTSAADAANNGCASRKFVAGEKFWITGVTPQKDGILIATISDPYPDPSGNQARYYGEIKFPFAKGSVPAPDDFVKTVSEVFTVAPPDDSQGGQGGQGGQSDQGGQPAQAAAPPSAPTPPPAPMADIAPPPPPADTPPPTIALGQTKDQVIAAFGQPTRMAKVGAKEILYYKDMKVTLTSGKVSNVE